MFNRKNKKLKDNVEKLKKLDFNYNKYVRDFYIENNTAYISIKVKDYHDIISKYSIDNYEWLNGHFAEYIEETSYYIPIEYEVTLDINGKFTDEEKERIIKTIKLYYGIKLEDACNQLRENKRKNLLLFTASVLFMFIFLILTLYINNFRFLEPISIILWFIIWEYLNNSFIEKRRLKEKRLEIAQLTNMQVKFNEDVTRKREV